MDKLLDAFSLDIHYHRQLPTSSTVTLQLVSCLSMLQLQFPRRPPITLKDLLPTPRSPYESIAAVLKATQDFTRPASDLISVWVDLHPDMPWYSGEIAAVCRLSVTVRAETDDDAAAATAAEAGADGFGSSDGPAGPDAPGGSAEPQDTVIGILMQLHKPGVRRDELKPSRSDPMVEPNRDEAMLRGGPSICGGDWGRFPVNAWHDVLPLDVVYLSNSVVFVSPGQLVDLADIVPAFDNDNLSYRPVVGTHESGRPKRKKIQGKVEGAEAYTNDPILVNVYRPALLRAYRRV